MPVNRARDAYKNTYPKDVGVPVDWLPLEESTEGWTAPPEGFDCFRGIRATGEGNVVAVMGGGEERTLAFSDGETRWGIFQSIVSATATGLEGAL